MVTEDAKYLGGGEVFLQHRIYLVHITGLVARLLQLLEVIHAVTRP